LANRALLSALSSSLRISWVMVAKTRNPSWMHLGTTSCACLTFRIIERAREARSTRLTTALNPISKGNMAFLLYPCTCRLNRERELVRLAQQSFHDIATHAVDFTYVTKLLWAETDNFPGTQTTVEEQVGHSMLMSVRKKCFEDLPHLTAVSLVGHFWLSWLRQ